MSFLKFVDEPVDKVRRYAGPSACADNVFQSLFPISAEGHKSLKSICRLDMIRLFSWPEKKVFLFQQPEGLKAKSLKNP